MLECKKRTEKEFRPRYTYSDVLQRPFLQQILNPTQVIDMRILIIEDEASLADVIAARLQQENFTADICLNGSDGLFNALSGIYDLIILDVMLPEIDGFEILHEIRKHKIESKVIMLTAKSMLEDKLTGLQGGANDYITKPFHMDELAARVSIQLRDPAEFKRKNILEYGGIELDTSKSLLINPSAGVRIELIRKEFQLLEYFMQNPGQVLSREQIYDRVWGMENESGSNNLEAYISFIRKKLKAADSIVNIKAVRGLGYKMEVNDAATEK